MEEIKPLNNDTNNEIPQEQNSQNQQSPTKIIIETEFSDFKKPEEPKLSQQNQIQESTQIDPQLPNHQNKTLPNSVNKKSKMNKMNKMI